MTYRDHAAALALLDRITPGPWAVDGHDGCIVTQSGKGEWDIADVYGHNVNNIRAIAALPELAALYRAGVELREADRAFYGTHGPRGTVKRLEDAGNAMDAALAAVADKLNNQPKSQGE